MKTSVRPSAHMLMEREKKSWAKSTKEQINHSSSSKLNENPLYNWNPSFSFNDKNLFLENNSSHVCGTASISRSEGWIWWMWISMLWESRDTGTQEAGPTDFQGACGIWKYILLLCSQCLLQCSFTQVQSSSYMTITKKTEWCWVTTAKIKTACVTGATSSQNIHFLNKYK